MSNARVVEIAKNIYWVGGKGQQDGLYCNPYLLVDEEEAVLIDPGSVLDFADVLGKCLKLVPLFEQKGANFLNSYPLANSETGLEIAQRI